MVDPQRVCGLSGGAAESEGRDQQGKEPFGLEAVAADAFKSSDHAQILPGVLKRILPPRKRCQGNSGNSDRERAAGNHPRRVSSGSTLADFSSNSR
jgi:hypothetical protein